MSSQKIYKKSTCFWKHGRHGSQITIAIMENKKSKKKASLEILDLSKGDWSKHKR